MRNLKRLKKAIGAILAAAVAVCMLVSLGMTGVSAEASNLLLNKRAVISGADRFDFNYDSTDAAKNGVNLTDGNDANQLMLWRKVENAGFTPDQVYDIETIFTWDLGAAYDLTGYKLIPAFQHHGWVLEVSSNGSTWESAAAVTDSGWVESANFSKGNIRHIRVTFNKAKATDVDAQMLQIKEIELYGTPYVAPATTTTTEEAVTTTTEAVTSTTNEASKGNLIYGKLPTLSGADQFDFSIESVDGNKNGAFLTDGSEEDGRHLMLWRKDADANYTTGNLYDIETIFTWDLGASYDLTGYKLTPTFNHHAWVLEVSADGNAWESAAAITDSGWTESADFSKSGVRYVRFTFTKARAVAATELMLQVKEIYIYGTPAKTPDPDETTTTTKGDNNTPPVLTDPNVVAGKRPTISGKDTFDYDYDSADPVKNGAYLTDGDQEKQAMLWRKDEGAGYTQDSMVDIETVLTWDLGWEYDLESYKLIPRYEHYAWKLELSRDGKTWTTVDTEADGTWSIEVTFKSLQKNVRYVRFTFTKALAITSDELMLQIKEVYVNAKSVSATKPSPGTGEAAVVLPIALVTGGALTALSAAMVLKRRSRKA